MNLISGTHPSCERREYVFMVFWEYTIIFPTSLHSKKGGIKENYIGLIWRKKKCTHVVIKRVRERKKEINK